MFLLPLIVFYEAAALFADHGIGLRTDRVIAYALIQWFVDLFGRMGLWAPAVVLAAILLATHAASGERWKIHWRDVAAMSPEAVATAIPLLLMNWLIPLQAAGGTAPTVVTQAALGVGAGVYEELVFRLVLISLLVIIGADVLRLDRKRVAVAACVTSALLFAAHHHQPIGLEAFSLPRFSFRTMAGLYLAVIFWFRGYGPAAGCHAAYNVALVLISAVTGRA